MSDDSPSQSLLLRLDSSLRQRVTELAREEGVSLNFFVTRALQEHVEKSEAGKAAAQAGLQPGAD